MVTVSEYYGMTELKNVFFYTILNHGIPLDVTPITTHQLATEEAYEGVLVRVENAIVTQEHEEYGLWLVDDDSGPWWVDEPLSRHPLKFEMYPNYPNPFNASTTLEFQLPSPVGVNLSVYNVRGERVAILIDGPQPPGLHRVIWDASGLASGLYFYRLTAGNYSKLGKMILLK